MLLTVAAGGPGVVFAQNESIKTPDIAVAKGSPAAATRAAINAIGGIKRFVKPGQKVVIKPNMSFAQSPETAANTHPLVVREVLALCKEAGAGRVRVLDHSLQNPEQALIKSGIRDACDGIEKGICHHLMEESFYTQASIPKAAEMKSNMFMKDVLSADVIIAIPVAKSHGSAGCSLSLKGQMGLIYDRRIMHSRYNLATAIVDMNMLIKPHLAVIDATRVLTTNGPGGPGKVITPGEVIASADAVAADAFAVSAYEWYGQKVTPEKTEYLRIAHERGLGRIDINNLQISRFVV
jgi:uncharacterized protein (DUF362 family)